MLINSSPFSVRFNIIGDINFDLSHIQIIIIKAAYDFEYQEQDVWI